MNTFKCGTCQKTFKAEGIIKECSHPVYGPCRKRIAMCPICGVECDEHRQKSSLKKSVDFDSYVNDLKNRGGGGCNPGGGCCG